MCTWITRDRVVSCLRVVKGSGPPLFGRDWLEAIQLDWKEIKRVKDYDLTLEEMLMKY